MEEEIARFQKKLKEMKWYDDKYNWNISDRGIAFYRRLFLVNKIRRW
jgi:hypothetical protein